MFKNSNSKKKSKKLPTTAQMETYNAATHTASCERLVASELKTSFENVA